MGKGKLEGKVAVVTGSSKGIGKAIAIEFAREGAVVVVNYNTDEKGAKDALTSIRKVGGKGIIFKADIRKKAEVQAMLQKAIKEFKHVDILVNNAGLIERTNFFDLTGDGMRMMLDTNVIGVINCCQVFGDHMLEDGGSMINMSSIVGSIGSKSSLIYGASKAAVDNITKELAKELAPQVRVNAIAPGLVSTGWMDKMGKDRVKDVIGMKLIKRPIQPEEIARLAVFLASDDAAMITGEIIYIDGGMRLK